MQFITPIPGNPDVVAFVKSNAKVPVPTNVPESGFVQSSPCAAAVPVAIPSRIKTGNVERAR
jgi:hypothetical protein